MVPGCLGLVRSSGFQGKTQRPLVRFVSAMRELDSGRAARIRSDLSRKHESLKPLPDSAPSGRCTLNHAETQLSGLSQVVFTLDYPVI
jgi:hypothetical protein